MTQVINKNRSNAQRLVVRISEDQGETWPRKIVVHEKAGAYSDVAVLPDGTTLLVFEKSDTVGRPYQRVSIARVSLGAEKSD